MTAPHSLYDPAVALAFFRSAGKPERFAPGATLFAENARARPLLLQRDRMYYVYDGEVSLVAKKKVIGPGGVFGEAALVDQSTRMASVQAETDCSLQPVGRTAFLELVKVSPVFAERMLSALAQRLRLRLLTARLD